MSSGQEIGSTARQLFDRDEVDGVLNGSFYTPREATEASVRTTPVKPAGNSKPTHYKVICISMYTDALAALDEMVRELKSRGYTKANRSALIRHALSVVDLDGVPRGI